MLWAGVKVRLGCQPGAAAGSHLCAQDLLLLCLGKGTKWLQTALFQPCPEILLAGKMEVIILSRQLT